MPYEPFERVEIGRTGLRVTRLGFGAGSIAGLYASVADGDAISVVDRAWQIGVRFFDAAPLYGFGNGERRLGAALAGRPRDDYVLSTKVGRLVRRADSIPLGADVDRQAIGESEDAYFADTQGRRMVFDYTADGIRRSVEESLERLGLDHLDILFVHDPDDHWESAIGQAYPALRRLRDEGVVRAIGVGMNQAAMLVRFATEADFDLFLVASRYTLLDQTALDELLPRCEARGIAVVVGGVMNTGILADPKPGSRFDYGPAPTEVIERARRLGAICERHGVPLRAAAVQFPLAHPAVVGLVVGVRSVEHLDEYPALMRRSIPTELWSELRSAGLIPAAAPTPP
jgi:D-threo-aldose 1-dehydrogenase